MEGLRLPHFVLLPFFSLYLFILVWLWNKQFFTYVNHAPIRSWNQPVLSNEKQQWASNGARTHDWQVSIDHESDALPTMPRRLFYHFLVVGDKYKLKLVHAYL